MNSLNPMGVFFDVDCELLFAVGFVSTFDKVKFEVGLYGGSFSWADNMSSTLSLDQIDDDVIVKEILSFCDFRSKVSAVQTCQRCANG